MESFNNLGQIASQFNLEIKRRIDAVRSVADMLCVSDEEHTRFLSQAFKGLDVDPANR